MRRQMIFIIILLCHYLGGYVYSGGWDNSLIGARPAGMAAAFVGLANDANAIFYNPAGLSFISADGGIIICGKRYFPIHTYINTADKKSISENPANLFEVFTYYRLSPKLTFGLGAYTPYAGGGIRWAKEDIGFDLAADVGVMALSPTFSYKLSETIAIGLNINCYYLLSHQKLSQGATFLNTEETDFVVSYSASIFIKPNKKWSFGVTYHGPSDVKMTGNTETSEIKVDSETKFYLPFSLAIGFAHHISKKLTLVGEYDFFRWSKLDTLVKTIYFPAPIGTIVHIEKLGFRNSYYLKFGGEYDLNDSWTIRLGFSYDRGAVPKETLSLTNIDVDKINYLGGFTYHWGACDLNVGAFYSIGKEQRVSISDNVTMPGNFNLDARGILVSINRSF
ncbi:MAG: outer membrane protein transport protein [bacterium]|nr:MAG: outer membrane protein transport protein [bacterium]